MKFVVTVLAVSEEKRKVKMKIMCRQNSKRTEMEHTVNSQER